MSTIWGGICLSHNPPIEFDLFDSGREIKRAELAVAVIRAQKHHQKCDVLVGGYSYPLVTVVCPCERRTNPKEYGIEDLRLVLAAARAGVGSEVAEWLRHNSCWTLERLTKLLDNEGK